MRIGWLRLRIGCLRLRGHSWRRRCARSPVLRAIVAVRLHAPELAFELLVAILQLFDRARELADLRFQAIEAHAEVAAGLGHAAGRRTAIRRSARVRRRALAVAKKLIEEAKAIRVIMNALANLPTPKARDRVIQYINHYFDEQSELLHYSGELHSPDV